MSEETLNDLFEFIDQSDFGTFTPIAIIKEESE